MTTAAPPSGATYSLSLIGGFDLRLGGDRVRARDSGARLLALLAVAGRRRPVSRAHVTDRLWSGDAGSPARLRSTLWRLPRDNDVDLVRGTPTSLQLADGVEVDLWQAEHRARTLSGDDDTADLTPELLEFSADLLPDWQDDWLLLERESFRQTRLHALERTSERLRRHGMHEAALQAALTAVACEPLRETAHRRVVEAHLAEGNPAEALRQYQSYRRLLALELGLAPTPALRNLVAPLLGRPADHRSPTRGDTTTSAP